jgi:hypothetical protein
LKWNEFIENICEGSVDEETRAAIQENLLRRHNEAEDREYFRSRVESGLMERCPNPTCRRLIEVIAMNCGRFVCGDDAHGGNRQSGCGTDINWNLLPNMAVDDFPEIKEMKVSTVKHNHSNSF